MTDPTALPRERTDLIESLRRHRSFLRFTVRDLTEEQAQLRPTVGALNLAGLIKHVAATEASWVRFAEGGAEAMRRNWGPAAWSRTGTSGAGRRWPACSPSTRTSLGTPTTSSPRCRT